MPAPPALDRAIAAVGSASILARTLGVSRTAITLWRQRDVPVRRVLSIEAATGVARHELRPDIYPPPAAA